MGAPKLAQVVGDSHLPLLRTSPLFQGLNDAGLSFVAERLHPVFVRAGEPIILQNEVSDDVFLTQSGSIEIVTYVNELKQINRLAVLKAGAHFSEFSVLNKTTKSASGFALEDTHLLRLSGSHFLEVLNRYPVVAKNLVLRLAELNNVVSASKVFVEYYKPQLIQVHPQVLEILPVNMWKRFEVLPLSYQVPVMTVAMRTPYNEAFYEQIANKAPTTHLNVYLIGEKDYDKTELQLRSYYLGGETPPAQPNVAPLAAEGTFLELLKKQSLFEHLPSALLQQLEPHFKPLTLARGQTLFKVGDTSRHFYIVEKGTIEIAYPVRNTPAFTHVADLSPGSGFGEQSILHGKPHQHLAVAKTESVVRALDVSIFQELMKAPQFLLPMAQDLAKRLHKKNLQIGLKFFEHKGDFSFAELADLIPLSVMKAQKIIPLTVREGELVVGLVNPENQEIYSIVSRYLNQYRVSLQMISQQSFNVWVTEIQKHLAQKAPQEKGKAKKSGPTARGEVNPVEELNKIFHEALINRSSDIHFEPGAENVSIRFRVDGVLHERGDVIPKTFHRELINRIKILAEMDISNDKTPQDGQLKLKLDDVEFVARVSTVPTKKGEKAVLRVIRASGAVVPLNMIAPDKRVIRILQEVAKAKQGLFLVTGPTGSGKSTTLYSLLTEINQIGVNIMTVEDPVEKELAGLNQVQLHPKAGLTFPAALRSFLRQDPDVIMVGEIRDEESAHIVLEAAITGHLVLSTMHTNSSLDTVNRLAEFGVSPVTIASALLGCVSQRLLRANCKSCAEPRPITEFEKEFFKQNLKGVTPPTHVHEGRGCPRCNGSGFLDRIPVFEIWQSTEEMRLTLAQKDRWKDLRMVAEKDGFESIVGFGLRMVMNGLTTVDEVKRCLF